MTESEAFKYLYDVIARLRGLGGCPWDQEQNPQSLRGDLLEETYECLEAIDEKDPAHIREELGDLYLLVTMLSYMHQEEGLFTVAETLEGIGEKLVRRHPHVFGETKVKDSAEVLRNWAKIKVEQEGRRPKDSVLDEVSRSLPPLDRACKLQKKAAKAGFDWSVVEDVINKVWEELGEAEEILAETSTTESAIEDSAGPMDEGGPGQDTATALEAELGDLLFSVINLCRFLKIDPSVALQRTNVKFEKRFRHVEKTMKEQGLEMKKENLALMDRYWEEAKGM
jgi:tetrapyrrole methylase family protein/MazG family protein